MMTLPRQLLFGSMMRIRSMMVLGYLIFYVSPSPLSVMQKETMSNTHKFTIDRREVTTTVVATVAELDRCLRDLLSIITTKHSLSKRVVGLGIEKRFETIYSTGSKVDDRVAIVNLCHGTTCLIIQLHLMSPPPFSLSAFLQRPELSIVGVGIKHSLEALETEYSIRCRNAVDLAQLAASVKKNDQFRAFGLFDLAYNVCQFCRSRDRDEKMVSDFHEVALSNWGVTTLSKKQIEVATWTSFMCFYVGIDLLDESCGPCHPLASALNGIALRGFNPAKSDRIS